MQALKIAAVLAAAIAAGAMLLDRLPAPRADLSPRTSPPIAEAKNWGYQLQRVYPALMPAEIDVLVVDYSRDGGASEVLAPADVAALRVRPDGTPRIVLAYLSVGEAEVYRYYWRRLWNWWPPTWLDRENTSWKGNYRVRYWDDGWQRILFERRRSRLDQLLEIYMPWREPYIDRILAAGFDGVYLDRVDAFESWAKGRPSAEQEMIDFVSGLSRQAKSRRPGFLVIPQNGEELLRHDVYRRAIDGVAKEDLLFGVEGDEKENEVGDAQASIKFLNRARNGGLPVFVVEYVMAPDKRAEALRRLGPLGFIVQFARRELNLPPEPPSAKTPQR